MHRWPTRSGTLLAPLLLSACGLFGAPGATVPAPAVESGTPAAVAPAEPAPAPDPYQFGDWAEETLATLTLRQKVGQMMMPFVLGDYAPKGSASHGRMARLVEEDEVGGIIMSVGSPTDVAVKLNDLQGHAAVPLLIGADLETGPGFRLSGAIHSPTNIVLGGATQFPNLMALGATGDAGLAYEMGRITALEARAVGIHLPFAPVLDVNNNPDNPIINVRSFGEDPAAVSRLGTAFIRGVQEHGGIATGKHFPGHGDTGVDSHLELPVIQASAERMDSVELRPFQAAVDAGMGAVMTAHITVPALNGGTDDPATLSPAVLQSLLRERMGFDGLLVTDAMDMGAIARGWGRDEATVRAVEAGADIILMPPSTTTAIDALVGAVHDGRIPESRIDASVLRILRTKEQMGLHRQRFVSLERLPSVVGIPAHTDVASRVARESITLLRNERELLPLRGTRNARVISLSYRREADHLAARYFNSALRARYPRLQALDVYRDSDPEVYDMVLGAGGGGRPGGGLPLRHRRFVQRERGHPGGGGGAHQYAGGAPDPPRGGLLRQSVPDPRLPQGPDVHAGVQREPGEPAGGRPGPLRARSPSRGGSPPASPRSSRSGTGSRSRCGSPRPSDSLPDRR
jgi:beta-N-acetylhexosaminidase